MNRRSADGDLAAANSPDGVSSEPKVRKATRRRARSGIRALARAHADAAVAALVAVMSDSSATPAARVSAASALLNWGYGKAASEADGGTGGASKQVVRLVWAGDDIT